MTDISAPTAITTHSVLKVSWVEQTTSNCSDQTCFDEVLQHAAVGPIQQFNPPNTDGRTYSPSDQNPNLDDSEPGGEIPELPILGWGVGQPVAVAIPVVATASFAIGAAVLSPQNGGTISDLPIPVGGVANPESGIVDTAPTFGRLTGTTGTAAEVDAAETPESSNLGLLASMKPSVPPTNKSAASELDIVREHQRVADQDGDISKRQVGSGTETVRSTKAAGVGGFAPVPTASEPGIPSSTGRGQANFETLNPTNQPDGGGVEAIRGTKLVGAEYFAAASTASEPGVPSSTSGGQTAFETLDPLNQSDGGVETPTSSRTDSTASAVRSADPAVQRAGSPGQANVNTGNDAGPLHSINVQTVLTTDDGDLVVTARNGPNGVSVDISGEASTDDDRHQAQEAIDGFNRRHRGDTPRFGVEQALIVRQSSNEQNKSPQPQGSPGYLVDIHA